MGLENFIPDTVAARETTIILANTAPSTSGSLVFKYRQGDWSSLLQVHSDWSGLLQVHKAE